jgi:hypothetical protein
MDTCGEGPMAMRLGGRVKSSTYLDRDVLLWLQKRGQRLERTVSWQIREVLRALMDAEQKTPSPPGQRTA